MHLPQPLFAGRLLRRYQRFFAEVELLDGQVVTAHTPNTGSMRQCAEPGHRVLLSISANPARQLPYTWELVEVAGHWVDVNTLRANRVVEEALCSGMIADFAGCTVRPEFPWGRAASIFAWNAPGSTPCWSQERHPLLRRPARLLSRRGDRAWPEASARAAAGERGGWRAAVLFLVQRGTATAFSPADTIDPEYGRLLRAAVAGGVEALAYRTRVTPQAGDDRAGTAGGVVTGCIVELRCAR